MPSPPKLNRHPKKSHSNGSKKRRSPSPPEGVRKSKRYAKGPYTSDSDNDDFTDTDDRRRNKSSQVKQKKNKGGSKKAPAKSSGKLRRVPSP
jgi:hypothetical protein